HRLPGWPEQRDPRNGRRRLLSRERRVLGPCARDMLARRIKGRRVGPKGPRARRAAFFLESHGAQDRQNFRRRPVTKLSRRSAEIGLAPRAFADDTRWGAD